LLHKRYDPGLTLVHGFAFPGVHLPVRKEMSKWFDTVSSC
jgi:hypothetical protein